MWGYGVTSGSRKSLVLLRYSTLLCKRRKFVSLASSAPVWESCSEPASIRIPIHRQVQVQRVMMMQKSSLRFSSKAFFDDDDMDDVSPRKASEESKKTKPRAAPVVIVDAKLDDIEKPIKSPYPRRKLADAKHKKENLLQSSENENGPHKKTRKRNKNEIRSDKDDTKKDKNQVSRTPKKEQKQHFPETPESPTTQTGPAANQYPAEKEQPEIKRSTQPQLRNIFSQYRLHSKFYKELWEGCDIQHHNRSREEVETFVQNLAMTGYSVHGLYGAAHKIQLRAQMATDYHQKMTPASIASNDTSLTAAPSFDSSSSSLPDSLGLGPLTLVIPVLGFDTKKSDPELYQLTEFLCKSGSDDAEDDDGSSDSETILVSADDNEYDESAVVAEDVRHSEDSEPGDNADDDGHTEEDGHHTEDSQSNEKIKNESGSNKNLVECLIKLRYRSLFVAPISWTHSDESTIEKRRQAYLKISDELHRRQARSLAVKIQTILPMQSARRMLEVLQEYIDATNEIAAFYESQQTNVVEATETKVDPGSEQESLVINESEQPESTQITEVGNTTRQPPLTELPFRVLNKPLYCSSKSHYHWIAPEFIHFLNCGADQSELHTDKFSEDSLIEKARHKWTTKRDEIVDTLMNIQERLLRSIETLQNHIQQGNPEGSQFSANDSFFMIDWDSLNPKSPSIRKMAKKRAYHVHFECITKPSDVVIPPPPPFIVAVDNLPIDTTVEEMDKWYSRFGSLKSIAILNQRPELDPGRLTLKATREIAKRKTNKFVGGFRPRSPVYALLEFADETGYKTVTTPDLCVFGMIVRRHDMRTIPAHGRLHSLFIEELGEEKSQPFLFETANLAKKFNFPLRAADVESELRRNVEPLWVALSSGQSGRTPVGSCEIKFSCFDVAWHAYQEITSKGELKNIHWLRSPIDSIEWWTRMRGFYAS